MILVLLSDKFKPGNAVLNNASLNSATCIAIRSRFLLLVARLVGLGGY